MISHVIARGGSSPWNIQVAPSAPTVPHASVSTFSCSDGHLPLVLCWSESEFQSISIFTMTWYEACFVVQKGKPYFVEPWKIRNLDIIAKLRSKDCKIWWTPDSFCVCSTLYSLFVERLNRSGCMINAGPVAIPTKATHSPLDSWKSTPLQCIIGLTQDV